MWHASLLRWFALHGLWQLVCLSGIFSTSDAQAQDQPATADLRRPNIVLILADDQAWRDFGFMGNAEVHTPHLDQLAQQSAVFPNGYVPMSVCRPSLATVLTGLYPHQHGIYFNHPPPGLKKMQQMSAAEYHQQRATTDDLIEHQPTLPRILSNAGYETLQTGKHWEGHYSCAGFTRGMTTGLPADDDRYGTRLQNGEPVAHGNGDRGLSIGRDTMQPIADFLDDVAGHKPFLIWYAPFLPHTPFDADRKYYEPYAGREIDPKLLPYYAEITRFDDTVGQLWTLLAERNLTASTLLVLASDNGYRPSDVPNAAGFVKHNARSKMSEYEDGLRTPILFSWPGTLPEGRYEAIVQTVDLLPTILTAAGLAAEIPPGVPGISLWQDMLQQKSPPARAAYGAIYPNDATDLGHPERDVRARWLRSGDFKLILPSPQEKNIPPALYNLKDDPVETNNLYAQKNYRPLINQLQQNLNQWWDPHQPRPSESGPAGR